MATDAKIQRVEELAAYSNHLGNFIESMSKNFTSFNNVMMQKLQVLRQKEKEAMEIETEATTEWKELFREFVSCPSEDARRKADLANKLTRAERKKIAAQRLCSIVKREVGVAKGVARCMLDDSYTIHNKLRNNISKGRNFLKNASVQLEQYKDNSNKI